MNKIIYFKKLMNKERKKFLNKNKINEKRKNMNE